MQLSAAVFNLNNLMPRQPKYAYDLSGNIVQRNLGNGTKEVRTHDGRNRVCDVLKAGEVKPLPPAPGAPTRSAQLKYLLKITNKPPQKPPYRSK
jgi:hypothetical protein